MAAPRLVDDEVDTPYHRGGASAASPFETSTAGRFLPDVQLLESPESPDGWNFDSTGTAGRLVQLDIRISSAIHASNNKVIEILLVIPAMLFSWYGVAFVLLAVFLTAENGQRVWVASVVLSCAILIGLWKHLAARERPNPRDIAHRWLDLRCMERATKAFPSGDTAMSAAVLCTVAWYAESWWLLALVPLVGMGRVYFGCHWIGDVVVGSLMGLAVALVVGAVLRSEPMCASWQSAGPGFTCMCPDGHGGSNHTVGTALDWWDGSSSSGLVPSH